MKTLMFHAVASLLLFYIYVSGASAFKAFPRHQQNNNDVPSGNATLTLFEKIRRFKEAFREMIRTSYADLRATMGAQMHDLPVQGQHKVPTGQQPAGKPIAQVPSTAGVAQPGLAETAPVTQPGETAAQVNQPVTQQAVPVAQPAVGTAPVAQPAVSTAPVAIPGVATTQTAQPAVATAPVAQPVKPQAVPVAQQGGATAQTAPQPAVATAPTARPADATKPVVTPATQPAATTGVAAGK